MTDSKFSRIQFATLDTHLLYYAVHVVLLMLVNTLSSLLITVFGLHVCV